MASQYPGLLLTDADRHQALYRGLLDAGANMGGASRLPSSFLERFSRGAQAFGQGQQNALNQTRQQQLQNMQAQSQQQQMAAQQQKLQQQQLQAQNLKNLQAVFGNPNSTPQQKQAAISAAYPEMYARQHLASTMPAPTSSRPSAPIQNYAQRQELVKKFGENSPQVRQFDNYVRATQYQNTGSQILAMNPQNPAAPVPVAEMQLKPGERPEVRGAQTAAVEEQKFLAKKRQEYADKGVKSQDALDALVGVEDLIENSTGSWAGAGVDQLARAFGVAPQGALNASKLAVIQAKLMLSQPRMEGPQSDRDVDLYRQAAGNIGDPTIPNAQKLAALETIKNLHSKYADGGKKSDGNVMRFDAQGNLIE